MSDAQRIRVRTPEGDIRTVKAGHGIEGPFLVVDGRLMKNPNEYRGWTLVDDGGGYAAQGEPGGKPAPAALKPKAKGKG